MRRLEISEMLDHIERAEPMDAVAADYSFRLKVESYAPYICAAVHEGHQFRRSLWDLCTHTEYERWYEEDPATLQMVSDHPIVLAGSDSRFEYDLNRTPEECVFETAWGRELWKGKLPEAEREVSLQKHRSFYRIAHALVEKIETLHGGALVIDMHSYNWKRWQRIVPTWNLGTSQVDMDRYGAIVESWRKKLEQVELPYDIPKTAAINDVFFGKGYFLGSITRKFPNTLVLATEIAKVYCDELSGVIFPEVVDAVQRQLKEFIPLQLAEFRETL